MSCMRMPRVRIKNIMEALMDKAAPAAQCLPVLAPILSKHYNLSTKVKANTIMYAYLHLNCVSTFGKHPPISKELLYNIISNEDAVNCLGGGRSIEENCAHKIMKILASAGIQANHGDILRRFNEAGELSPSRPLRAAFILTLMKREKYGELKLKDICKEFDVAPTSVRNVLKRMSPP